MGKVITESVLRSRFVHGVPETLQLRDGQILTPAAAQYLGEKKVKIVRSGGIAPNLDGEVGFISAEDGRTYSEKPEDLTHLSGKLLVTKDHPRIVFRGHLDHFQGAVLLLQQQSLSEGNRQKCKLLEDFLQRARAIMRADVLGETLGSCCFDNIDEEQLRNISHRPEEHFGLRHLVLSADMPPWVLSLNRLRTLVRKVEISVVTAFNGKHGDERQDIIHALNRLSSALYVLMLKEVKSESLNNASGAINATEIVSQVLKDFSSPESTVPVELSARHVHLGEKDVEKLFGGTLTETRELSQPGQYLCRERVRLVGPKGILDNVAVLGPARGQTQVEISLSDARILGVEPPVRQSGDTSGSPGIEIQAGDKSQKISEGLLIPGRHIHMHPDDACRFGVTDQDLVGVKVGKERSLLFDHVLVRVNKDYRLAMHIDFDEGNACGWKPSMTGCLIKSQYHSE